MGSGPGFHAVHEIRHVGGTFAPEGEIKADNFDGNLVVGPDDEPLVTISHDVWRRSGEEWDFDQFTADAPINAVPALDGNDLRIVWDTASDALGFNHGRFGEIDEAADELIVHESVDVEEPCVRWQFNNLNDPSPNRVDLIYFDDTNNHLKYVQIDPSPPV